MAKTLKQTCFWLKEKSTEPTKISAEEWWYRKKLKNDKPQLYTLAIVYFDIICFSKGNEAVCVKRKHLAKLLEA